MGVYRATVDLDFPVGSGGGTNTWTLRTTGVYDSASIQALMGYVQEFYDDLNEWFPTNYTWTWDGTVTELGTPSPSYFPPEPSWTLQGIAANSSYSPVAAMVCVNWRSSLASRSGRGRTFLGPLTAAAAEGNGTPSPTAIADFRAAAASLVSKSTLFAGDGALAVWSELDGVARDFVSSSVTDQYAVLRSRRS